MLRGDTGLHWLRYVSNCLLKSFSGSDLTPNVSASLQDQQNQVFFVGKER